MSVWANQLFLLFWGHSFRFLRLHYISLGPQVMRNGVFPAISVNQDDKVISFQPSRVLRKEECTPGLTAIRLEPLPKGDQGKSGCEKCKGYGPRIGEMHEKNDFSEHRLLHLPIHSKVLNSFTWDIWFSLLHKNTFEVQTTCPYLQTSIQPDSPSPPTPHLLGALLSGWLEILSPEFPPSKT